MTLELLMETLGHWKIFQTKKIPHNRKTIHLDNRWLAKAKVDEV